MPRNSILKDTFHQVIRCLGNKTTEIQTTLLLFLESDVRKEQGK